MSNDITKFKTNFDAIADQVYYLKDRWADEREYEDFATYKANLVAFFATFDMKVLGVTKNFKVTLASGMMITFLASGTIKWKVPA